MVFWRSSFSTILNSSKRVIMFVMGYPEMVVEVVFTVLAMVLCSHKREISKNHSNHVRNSPHQSMLTVAMNEYIWNFFGEKQAMPTVNSIGIPQRHLLLVHKLGVKMHLHAISMLISAICVHTLEILTEHSSSVSAHRMNLDNVFVSRALV